MKIVNLRSYVKSITDLSSIGYDCDIVFNNVGNFSIVPVGKENYLATFRVFGYYIDECGRYLTDERMKLERPDEHLFVLLDSHFNFVRRLELKRNTYYVPTEFKGSKTYLEDMRLVKWEGEIYGVSSTFYLNSERWDKMGLEVQKISLDIDSGEVYAEHVWNNVEKGVGGQREKNWLPIEDRPFHFIMGTYEHGAQWIDISTNEIGETGTVDKNNLYRGNTPLVKIEGGYLAVTHKVVTEPGKVKEYQNYLVKYGNDLSVQRISSPFKLTNQPIEFVTVLLPLNEKDVLIGVTSNDDTPEIHTYDSECLLRMVNRNITT